MNQNNHQIFKSYSILVRLIAVQIFDLWKSMLIEDGYMFFFKNKEDILAKSFYDIKNTETIYEFLHLANTYYKGISSFLNINETCSMVHDVWINHNSNLPKSQTKTFTNLSYNNKKYYLRAHNICYELYWQSISEVA